MDNRYRKDAGENGENAALTHLQQAGLKLISKNYRFRGGELDLVMLEKQTLVFIEVRFRRNRDFGGALASVTAKKQQRMMLTAQHFLQSHPEYQSLRARFDVVSLEGSRTNTTLQWVRDAFSA